jgi:geranylgeranyl pyrophosphate synthase
LPLIAAARQAPPVALRRLEELSAMRNRDERAACWAEVRAFVTDHGGVDHAFTTARRFGDAAKEALGPVASGPQKDLLAVAVEYVINRLN